MKFLKTLIVLLLTFVSYAKADDVQDFTIEGISVGNSAFDFFSKSEIDKSNTLSRNSKNINSPSTSSYSPINDKETLITRMFKGKSDRIG